MDTVTEPRTGVSEGPDDEAVVVLASRCEPRYARVVRTVVASCASLEDFSVDRLGDVRLLADEVFNAAVALGADTVVFRLRPAGGVLEMDVVADRPDAADASAAAAAELQIVEMVAGVVAPGAALSVDDRRLRFVAEITLGPS